MQSIMEPQDLTSFLPLLIASGTCALLLGLLHFFLIHRQQSLSSEEKFPRQLLLLGLTILALVILVLAAPLSESLRNQVLALLGIVVSGVLAFSSTSFVTNFMAAIGLRVTQPFKVGDFITIGDHFGKVVSRGLLDTEIQTENRELIAIPNVTFTMQPVVVARRSGVIVTSTLSLGYDIPHNAVESLMLTAAAGAGLEDPYIHVARLGDFAVTYKVCGLLADVERILTVRSDLNRQLLDTLHGAGLEIVSPTVTRHITQDAETRIIPESVMAEKNRDSVEAEEIAFDIARAVDQLEKQKQLINEQLADKQGIGDAERERLRQQLELLKEQEKKLREGE